MLAWPYYLKLTKSDEAELINFCRFVRVTPADAEIKDVDGDTKPADKDAPEARYQVSRCLSRMRAMMTSGEAFTQDGEQRWPLAARIIMDGQTAGYSGFMPGLLEEFLMAIQQNVPTYVVGAFGGIAGWLARALLGDIAIDTRFTLEDQLTKEQNTARGLPALIEVYRQHEADGVKQPEVYYEELRAILERARQEGIADTLRNGLSSDDNQRLMRADREAEILALLEKGLRRVLA